VSGFISSISVCKIPCQTLKTVFAFNLKGFCEKALFVFEQGSSGAVQGLKVITKLNAIESAKLFLYQIASTYIKIITLWRS
jgi:hypothetical protein